MSSMARLARDSASSSRHCSTSIGGASDIIHSADLRPNGLNIELHHGILHRHQHSPEWSEKNNEPLRSQPYGP